MTSRDGAVISHDFQDALTWAQDQLLGQPGCPVHLMEVTQR